MALVAVGIFVIGSFAVFKQGLNIFSSRFGNASSVQTGFVGRFFHTFITPFEVTDEVGMGGVGLGMGTNVAAGLMVGKREFMVAEEEGARVVMEDGPLVGAAYLLLRMLLAGYLATLAWRALRRHASTLPLLLFSSCFYSVMLGQFAQATELGFAGHRGGFVPHGEHCGGSAGDGAGAQGPSGRPPRPSRHAPSVQSPRENSRLSRCLR